MSEEFRVPFHLVECSGRDEDYITCSQTMNRTFHLNVHRPLNDGVNLGANHVAVSGLLALLREDGELGVRHRQYRALPRRRLRLPHNIRGNLLFIAVKIRNENLPVPPIWRLQCGVLLRCSQRNE